MLRYVLTIEYDGTEYCGWQRQINALSVQEVLEEKLSIVLQEKVVLVASGRTDAGVHAKCQVAHFDCITPINIKKIVYNANSLLPSAISIIEGAEAEEWFHAQYSAKEKTYLYRFYISEVRKPLLERYACQLNPKRISVEKIMECAKIFEGTHDFCAFSSTHRSVLTTVREIYLSYATVENGILEYRITGNGFLYNMVRMVAGALIAHAEGKISKEIIMQMLETGERGKYKFKTLPAKGLTLINVTYPR